MADNLYEYPEGYSGRKTYVRVVGHSDFVPKYKTYYGTDGKRHLHPDFGGTAEHMASGAAYVMPDKAGYLSPMDGKVIEGRVAHREHMRAHGVVEAGDMKLGEYSGRDRSPMGRAGDDIKRAVQELRSR